MICFHFKIEMIWRCSLCMALFLAESKIAQIELLMVPWAWWHLECDWIRVELEAIQLNIFSVDPRSSSSWLPQPSHEKNVSVTLDTRLWLLLHASQPCSLPEKEALELWARKLRNRGTKYRTSYCKAGPSKPQAGSKKEFQFKSTWCRFLPQCLHLNLLTWPRHSSIKIRLRTLSLYELFIRHAKPLDPPTVVWICTRFCSPWWMIWSSWPVQF